MSEPKADYTNKALGININLWDALSALKWVEWGKASREEGMKHSAHAIAHINAAIKLAQELLGWIPPTEGCT